MYKNYFKRLIDIVVSFFSLITLFPIIVVLCIVLFFKNKGEVFFFQERPGLNEKRFKLFKFKSMTDEKDENGQLLPYNKRITNTGRFIRKYSLDEIPQLINVLKGDMSIIGPRPLLLDYLPLYNETQKQRHLVKPGITGWAQINGRNTISWEKKFKLDVWYIKNLSFKIDCKIVLLTFKKVIYKENINNDLNINMPRFNGNN